MLFYRSGASFHFPFCRHRSEYTKDGDVAGGNGLKYEKLGERSARSWQGGGGLLDEMSWEKRSKTAYGN